MDAGAPTRDATTDSRIWWFGLAVVVSAALLLRWWGIDFGLPMVIHMDEWEQAVASKAFDEHGVVTGPRRWRYPPLLAELISARARLSSCGAECSPLERISFGREVSALSSALAAGGLYLAARGLGLRWLPAMTGGLLFACLPLLTRLGRYATPDALAAAMTAFALLAATRVAREGRTRAYLSASLFIGLAAAAKYNAGIVAAAYVFGAWLVRVRRDETSAAREGLRLVVAAVWSLAAFAIAIAAPWHDWADFAGGLELEWKHYVNGHAGFDCANAAWEALVYLFRFGLGPLSSLSIVAALGLTWRDRKSAAETEDDDLDDDDMAAWLIVTPSLLIYGVLLLRQEVFFARLTAPLIPGLCLLVAAAVHRIAFDAQRQLSAPVLASVCATLIALPLVHAIQQGRILARPDTRLLARDELRDTFVDSKKRFRIAVVPETGRRGLPKELRLRYVKPETSVERLRRRRFTHVLYGQGGVDRFNWRPARYEDELAPYLELHRQLESEAELIRRWEAPKLPGTPHFGDAGVLIHNYTLELWEL